MNTSLARISKTTDDNGDFNYPQLCVTNRPAVNLNEVYAIKLDQGMMLFIVHPENMHLGY